MWRNAGVYVPGRIRSLDHRTITLDRGNLILTKTEVGSRAMSPARLSD
jgi:hypothetical protein